MGVGMFIVLILVLIVCAVVHATIIGIATLLSRSYRVMDAFNDIIDGDKEEKKPDIHKVGRIQTDRQIGFECKWEES